MPLVLSGTTGVAGVDGSASTPAIQGTDTNSGIYFSGNQIGLSTDAGGALLTVDSNSNVTFPGTVAMATPFAMRNKIINGAMEIDQRYAGAVVSNVAGYFVDRWASQYFGSGRFSAQRSTTAPAGFINSSLLTVTTAASPGAGDYNNLYQGIEGLNIADLGWGAAGAKTVTLSFWIRCSVTGLYAVRLCNDGASRSYVATFNINSANTWEFKTITIPGDTTGTWLTTTGPGVFVAFDLGHGTNFNTTSPNTWVAGNYTRTASCVNLVANSGATLYFTGVQFEVGSVATPFERRLYPVELAMCQRYAERRTDLLTIQTGIYTKVYFFVRKRVAANVTVNSGTGYTGSSANDWSAEYVTGTNTNSNIDATYTAEF